MSPRPCAPNIAMANHLAPPDIPHMPLYSEAFDSDPRAFFDHWISTGSVPSEGDGSPFWSHFAHIASWWPYRHLPNVRLVHFNDLPADLDGEMRAIAEWLAIDVPERFWPEVVERATFASMKEKADEVAPVPFVFDGGGDSFRFRAIAGDGQLRARLA